MIVACSLVEEIGSISLTTCKEPPMSTETQVNGYQTWTDEISYLETESMFDIFTYWRRRKICICDFKTECNACPDFFKHSFRISLELKTRFPIS